MEESHHPETQDESDGTRSSIRLALSSVARALGWGKHGVPADARETPGKDGNQGSSDPGEMDETAGFAPNLRVQLERSGVKLSDEVALRLEAVTPEPGEPESDLGPDEIGISRMGFNAHWLGVMASVPCETWSLPSGDDAEKASAEMVNDVLEALR